MWDGATSTTPFMHEEWYYRYYNFHPYSQHYPLTPYDDDEYLPPWHRFLAKIPADQKPSRSDYSVLSVSVMTLGLILCVEILRHRLDYAALGRPLFSAVLEGVYRECKCDCCSSCHIL
jgi:hypothetical protein